MEKALALIDENIETVPINRIFISELHKQVVKNLTPPPDGEGSENPGYFRKKNVSITRSNHLPPDMSQVSAYMDELFAFIKKEDSLLLVQCLWLEPDISKKHNLKN